MTKPEEEKLRSDWKNKLQTEWGQDNRDSESFDDWSANQLIEKIKQSNLALLEEVEGMKEQLADLEHKRWAKWQSYIHSNLQYEERKFGSHTVAYYLLDAGKYEHWSRQIDTPYESLTEKEKDSDRVEAQNTIDLIIATLSKHKERLSEK
jgi:hypothetical protein